MQKQKGISTLTGIIIIVAVAILAFGGVFAWQYLTIKSQQNSQFFGSSQKTNQTQNRTAGWKTYRNAEYGFEFGLPSNLVKYQNESSIGMTFGVPDILGVSIVPEYKNISFSEIANQFLKSGNAKNSKNLTQKRITLSDKEGIRFDYNSGDNVSAKTGLNQTEIYMLLVNGSVLHISIDVDHLSYGTNGTDGTSIDKFLSTFKFTK